MLERSFSQLQIRDRIRAKIFCVNRSPIRYGFCAGAKAVQYGVNIASVFDSE